jgi:hypothetical protein
MKKVYVSFRAQLVGLMEFEVSDDFKLSGKQADEIWEDLSENYPDQIETDILNDELQNLWGIDLGGFTIDDLELDSIESFYIQDGEGNTSEKEFYINNSPLNLELNQ